MQMPLLRHLFIEKHQACLGQIIKMQRNSIKQQIVELIKRIENI